MVSTISRQDSQTKRSSYLGKRVNPGSKMISSTDEPVGDENIQPNHYFDSNGNGQNNMFSNHLALRMEQNQQDNGQISLSLK